MEQWIVWSPTKKGPQSIVRAETFYRAVQAAIATYDGFAIDWRAHRLATYPDHLQTRLLRESVILGA